MKNYGYTVADLEAKRGCVYEGNSLFQIILYSSWQGALPLEALVEGLKSSCRLKVAGACVHVVWCVRQDREKKRSC